MGFFHDEGFRPNNIFLNRVWGMFDFGLSDEKNEEILSYIYNVDHIAIVVSDIDKTLDSLKSKYPDAGYKIIKKFSSVSVPKKYPGSSAVIAHVKPDNTEYVGFEFFVVTWGSKSGNVTTLKEEIGHIALRVKNCKDLARVIELLKKIVIILKVSQKHKLTMNLRRFLLML